MKKEKEEKEEKREFQREVYWKLDIEPSDFVEQFLKE